MLISKNKKYNAVGLPAQKSIATISSLTDLLANYSILYMNVRGFHWNIKGPKFFELHAKFQELYENLQDKIDNIAERIVTLGGTAMHRYSDYIQQSQIVEAQEVNNCREAVLSLLDSFQIILLKQRELLAFSADNQDEGTNALMSDYIREQEKLVWMYSAYVHEVKEK